MPSEKRKAECKSIRNEIQNDRNNNQALNSTDKILNITDDTAEFVGNTRLLFQHTVIIVLSPLQYLKNG